MYCKFCGKEIADNSVFCQYCGKHLVEKEKGICIKKNWKNTDILRNRNIITILVIGLVLTSSFALIRNNTIYGKWYYIEKTYITELNIHMNGSWESVTYGRYGNNVYSQGKWNKNKKHICFDKGYYDNALLIKRGLLTSFLKCTERYGNWGHYDSMYFERHLFKPKFKQIQSH